MSVANKRIAVVGAHGVGKNTVCIKLLQREKFGERGINVTYMPETVRSTMFMNHDILAKEIGGNYDSCSWLFHRHRSQILEHAFSYEVFITKRLPLDYLVFNRCAFELGMVENKFEQYYWVIDDKAFILTLTCEESQYNDFQVIGEKILNSFNFIKN